MPPTIPLTNDTLDITHPLRTAKNLLTRSQYFWFIACLILIGEATLCRLIIRFIPYTEIDFETYMIQTDLYLTGQRDYSKITGPTGPLVYPAGHVHIHHLLYNLTEGGAIEYLPKIQELYAGLYLLTMALTFFVYRRAGIPQYVLLLLPLSKRLHSIYVLRLFNDCWAAPLSMGAIHAFQKRRWAIGCILFGLAISIKMNVLLYMPALCLTLLLTNGLVLSLFYLSLTFITILITSQPFLESYPREYLVSAFNLGRQFLYKWTVNWRFIPEPIFLSAPFARGLLLCHVALLGIFGLGAWCRKQGGALAVLERALQNPIKEAAISSVTQDYIATVFFTANLIGILCARSLHYQFYSWYATQLPLLAWRTKYPIILRIMILATIEYAWNTYPSTDLSSGLLLAAHILLVLGVLFGYPEGRNTAMVRWDDEIEVEKLD
ncbi:putative Dol-P-Man:Man(5)GlcNAc(2)-PP-Dol alpha-1,3-mannosyltransferase [Rhizoctonia solani 123E]|uniref:Dol-P-Man:Man(5)GlcNAc(2)-PP-Dol alpha-1,3-mannosyltransferase n=2 Tax=Rhizoctonia solani TaxID=456999 RepID=A0A074RMI3_9AGAM|nr:putative Dol-P-Man:Man(5)GlcNAc(2)-PP-Dol alpha-1,3-mannosyltransferase [Rhizoctonia solani 123E]